jgi:nicotinamidase/pyrazinamidase
MKALIVVDIQQDFCPGGNLAVKDGDKIVPIINELTQSKLFDLVIFTKDWHPNNHKSFASQHNEKNLFEVISLNGIEQVLWPDHCIQNTDGAEFHKDINLNINNFYIFKKGMNSEVDSYSGFFENDHKTSTGLSEFLKERKIKTVYVCGLALDFCCKYTAIDSVSQGFSTYVIMDGTKSISEEGKKSTITKFIENDIKLIDSKCVLTQ